MTKKTGNDRHNDNFPNEKQTKVDTPNNKKKSKTEFASEWDAKAEKNLMSHQKNK
ncbi:hypothetical protein [Rummeliibacillus pycnus]|uniref:hypothetical protein n=1 Tax=Rummeliibacillus pycnus TaxID=101070 RepID=UPI00147595FF|nr:hypothetical protein [Rummeliibacillus pycnus]